MVRVTKRAMRDKQPSQFLKSLYTDPIRPKKRKKDILAKESDVEAVPSVPKQVGDEVKDDDLNPPEGYIEFITSKEDIW